MCPIELIYLDGSDAQLIFRERSLIDHAGIEVAYMPSITQHGKSISQA